MYNVTNEINSIIQEEGEKVVFDLNIHGLDKRLIRGWEGFTLEAVMVKMF